jgi:hypothetical protein
MLQNPKVAFRDPELRKCRVEKDAMNQPRPWSGAFAVVYKGIDEEQMRPFAIRIFTTESPERRERYDLINEYLKSKKPACLVDFEFRENSVRSAGDGKWYPMILMDWVQGDTLFDWVRARALSGDREALSRVAGQWIELVRDLADAQIAHGDLQHANVMVNDWGELKLVDYDGMCVPALVGRRNLEIGVEPYQHPQRNESTRLSPSLDNYSALVIYVALRAVAADPGVWLKYVEQPGHDKLLFRSDDLRSPAGSALCQELRNSPDAEVRELFERLVQAGNGPIEQVPALTEITNPYAQVEQLLRQQQWEEAVRLLNRRKQFRDAPAELKPLIEEAYQQVRRLQAWQTFMAVPSKIQPPYDRQLAAAWNDELFAHFGPAREHRARARGARSRIELLDQVRPLLERSPQTGELVDEQAIAEAAARLPSGYLAAWQPRVELAQRRLAALARLEQAFQEPTSEEALAAAWPPVLEAEGQRFVDAERRARVELAQQRLPLLRALAQVPPNLPPDQMDRKMLAVWREDLLGDCAAAAVWRTAYHVAVYRKELLRRLQTAVTERTGGEIMQIVEDPCLEGYPLPPGWKVIVRWAREKLTKTRRLAAVLAQRQRAEFLAAFDVRLLRESPEQFAAHRALLADWARADVRSLEALGMGPAVARASLVPLDEPRGAYRVRWTWPPTRFSEQCLLAICPAPPELDDDPSVLPALERIVTTRPMWESGGGSRLLEAPPQWAGAYVVVWAQIDLGFDSFYSHPLVLGRFPPASRGWRPWHLFSAAHWRSSQNHHSVSTSNPSQPKGTGGP